MWFFLLLETFKFCFEMFVFMNLENVCLTTTIEMRVTFHLDYKPRRQSVHLCKRDTNINNFCPELLYLSSYCSRFPNILFFIHYQSNYIVLSVSHLLSQ